ncbi:MAG: ABC-type branched-chain amino acid transport system, ATPase component [Haloquadratum walsbyi J07HQW1]|jgi:branched-chain amino acid transport system ATP-binding protein|uniref:ABC-type branched-chain amino acid transport system, ATPase component n=1 Tax=Haloquadratum walsbyi J07HQW1 TaxID=1238424 RepID=U1PFN0_9EURY|nr:MAG: ABC-type branched-chain amino acid transport system, ATPase component [Haloquadratum walsbyi J07HQW1]
MSTLEDDETKTAKTGESTTTARESESGRELLRLNSVDAYYDESHILRDLSMMVKEGEICALLGRNGAGKTTTLRSIAGATPPTVRSGSIRFDGNDVTGVTAEDISIRGISLVPEERRIFPNLSVAENLHLAEVVNNASNTWGRDVEAGGEGMTTDEVYNQFPRLDERRSQQAGTLSGGEQQMLAIARALKQNTDLMLLDEPYEGLAPQIIEDVEDAIERINDTGTTILLVEQNAAAAINLADRAYVIDHGQIVFDGTAAELRSDEETRERYLGV